MATKSKADIYQQVTDKIVAALERGTAPWHAGWQKVGGVGGLPVRSCGTAYRGINVPLLWMAQEEAGYQSPQWITFKQAQAVGGNVRRGQKGTHIVFFKKLDIEDKDSGDRKVIPMIRGYTVFNVDQCDGLPDRFRKTWRGDAPGVNPDGHNKADDVLYATGAKIQHGGDRAFYRPATDHVQMPEFQHFFSADDYTSVLAHELCHWTGAEHRLDRDLRNSHGTTDYAREELVAEMGAAFLCAALGVSAEPREDHASYIESWLKVLKNDKKAIVRAASLAQSAADYVQECAAVGAVKAA